jgi:sugar diacid utilization regulator
LWAARTSPDRFDDDEHWAMEGCALLIALERTRFERHAEAEARLAKDLLADLLSPAAMVHKESVMARAKALGHDPQNPHTLALFVPVPGRRDPGRAQMTTRLVAAFVNATNRMRPRPVVGSVGDSVAVLLPQPAAAVATDPAAVSRLLDRARDLTGGTVRCVIGPHLQSLEELPPNIAVASRAAALVTTASPELLNMADFGVYGLLLESGSGEALTEFAKTILAPVIELDRRRTGELMATVRAWLACNMSNQNAARQLHVHANTVGYRIKQVATATGLDLANPANLVTLQLAALVYEVRGRTLDAL